MWPRLMIVGFQWRPERNAWLGCKLTSPGKKTLFVSYQHLLYGLVFFNSCYLALSCYHSFCLVMYRLVLILCLFASATQIQHAATVRLLRSLLASSFCSILINSEFLEPARIRDVRKALLLLLLLLPEAVAEVRGEESQRAEEGIFTVTFVAPQRQSRR